MNLTIFRLAGACLLPILLATATAASNVNYNFDGGRYPAGSPQWMEWCIDNYGQYFDPWTGQYLASDGRYYYCRAS